MSTPPAPTDPREDWDLPELGTLPTVADLDELTTRVLAPNPSAFTLDGTNTYVLGAPGTGEAVVLDPGPDDADHRHRVEQALNDRDAQTSLILVTHHHPDHAEAAKAWAEHFGCRVAAARRDVAGADGQLVAHGETISRAGLDIEVVATPGHAGDHLCFRLPSGALLSGDHVLGRGTSVVAPPDGDLADYLRSLRRVLDLGPDVLYPGHGPALEEDAHAVLRYYLEHREHRLRQILAALEQLGASTPRELVEVIYTDTDQSLWDAAELSTRAGLEVLEEEGRVESAAGGERVRLVS